MVLSKAVKGLRNPKLAYTHIKDRIINAIVNENYFLRESLIYGPESRVEVGNNSGVPSFVNTRSGKVIIGNNVMTGYHTFLLTGTHDYRKKGADRSPAVTDADRDIIVNDGVWIGWNCTIIGPCEIGENAVISAGSVVTDDCEAGCIYAGNPAEKVTEIDFYS